MFFLAAKNREKEMNKRLNIQFLKKYGKNAIKKEKYGENKALFLGDIPSKVRFTIL
jgi:hypothetical protein